MAIPREFENQMLVQEMQLFYAKQQQGMSGIGSAFGALAPQGMQNATPQQEPQPNRKLLLLGDVQ